MPIQSKINRAQVQFLALEQIVEQDSIVRIIDLFCQCIDYENLGFIVKGKSHVFSEVSDGFIGWFCLLHPICERSQHLNADEYIHLSKDKYVQLDQSSVLTLHVLANTPLLKLQNITVHFG